MRPLRLVPHRQATAPVTLRTVHRSPFFTQSVAVKRRVRLLARVITCSPTLAGLPSASIATATASGSVRVRFGGEPVGAGALVELADQFAGGGEHDRIQAAAPVGLPGREDVLGERGEVADMDCVRWSR